MSSFAIPLANLLRILWRRRWEGMMKLSTRGIIQGMRTLLRIIILHQESWNASKFQPQGRVPLNEIATQVRHNLKY